MCELTKKTCNKCNIEKSLDEFHKNRNECNECKKEYNREYHKKHCHIIKQKRIDEREERQKKPRVCIKCNIEKQISDFKKKGSVVCIDCAKKQNKEYNELNKDNISKCQKEYYKLNKERVDMIHNEYMIVYNELNKDKIKDSRKKYYIENKEIIQRKNKDNLEYSRIKQKEKYNNDPVYRTKCIIRSYTRRACYKGIKTGRSFELLGCDVNHLMNHLESQFTEEMSWENQGKVWHIDHIKPISKFTEITTCPLEQRLCSNWRNLQPLLAEDNLSKSDKWDDELEENIKHEEYLTEALIGLDLSTIELIL